MSRDMTPEEISNGMMRRKVETYTERLHNVPSSIEEYRQLPDYYKFVATFHLLNMFGEVRKKVSSHEKVYSTPVGVTEDLEGIVESTIRARLELYDGTGMHFVRRSQIIDLDSTAYELYLGEILFSGSNDMRIIPTPRIMGVESDSTAAESLVTAMNTVGEHIITENVIPFNDALARAAMNGVVPLSHHET